jgi:hypothetical protein
MRGFMLAALWLLSARAVAAVGAVSRDGVLIIVAKARYRGGTGAGTRQAHGPWLEKELCFARPWTTCLKPMPKDLIETVCNRKPCYKVESGMLSLVDSAALPKALSGATAHNRKRPGLAVAPATLSSTSSDSANAVGSWNYLMKVQLYCTYLGVQFPSDCRSQGQNCPRIGSADYNHRKLLLSREPTRF